MTGLMETWVEGYHFGGVLPEYEPDTPVYVFASHKHRGHFDMDMLLSQKNIRRSGLFFQKTVR